jgi:hypothetical protein
MLAAGAVIVLAFVVALLIPGGKFAPVLEEDSHGNCLLAFLQAHSPQQASGRVPLARFH